MPVQCQGDTTSTQSVCISLHCAQHPICLPCTRHGVQEEEGLLVKLDETRAGRPLSHTAAAAQWFAQDLFAAAEAEDDEQPPTTVPSTSRPGETRCALAHDYLIHTSGLLTMPLLRSSLSQLSGVITAAYNRDILGTTTLHPAILILIFAEEFAAARKECRV